MFYRIYYFGINWSDKVSVLTSGLRAATFRDFSSLSHVAIMNKEGILMEPVMDELNIVRPCVKELNKRTVAIQDVTLKDDVQAEWRWYSVKAGSMSSPTTQSFTQWYLTGEGDICTTIPCYILFGKIWSPLPSELFKAVHNLSKAGHLDAKTKVIKKARVPELREQGQSCGLSELTNWRTS